MYPNEIFPHNIKKYPGGIAELPSGRFRFTINRDSRVDIVFAFRAQAEEWAKKHAIAEGLPIKNIIYEFADHYEVELSRGHRALFDKADLKIIDRHIWHSVGHRNKVFAATNLNRQSTGMHQVLLKCDTVQHINNNLLDNRRANLVAKTKPNFCYTARWMVNGKEQTKVFPIEDYPSAELALLDAQLWRVTREDEMERNNKAVKKFENKENNDAIVITYG